MATKRTRLPNSEWHISQDQHGAWRVYPPGNLPHYPLPDLQWTKKQAYTIAALIESAYDTGAEDVRDEIKNILRIEES